MELLREHKRIIREAGKLARDRSLMSEATSHYAMAQVLVTASRALARNAVKTASILIQNSQVCAKHLYIVGRQILLQDVALFSSDIDAAKLELLRSEWASMENQMHGDDR